MKKYLLMLAISVVMSSSLRSQDISGTWEYKYVAMGEGYKIELYIRPESADVYTYLFKKKFVSDKNLGGLIKSKNDQISEGIIKKEEGKYVMTGLKIVDGPDDRRSCMLGKANLTLYNNEKLSGTYYPASCSDDKYQIEVMRSSDKIPSGTAKKMSSLQELESINPAAGKEELAKADLSGHWSGTYKVPTRVLGSANPANKKYYYDVYLQKAENGKYKGFSVVSEGGNILSKAKEMVQETEVRLSPEGSRMILEDVRYLVYTAKGSVIEKRISFDLKNENGKQMLAGRSVLHRDYEIDLEQKETSLDENAQARMNEMLMPKLRISNAVFTSDNNTSELGYMGGGRIVFDVTNTGYYATPLVSLFFTKEPGSVIDVIANDGLTKERWISPGQTKKCIFLIKANDRIGKDSVRLNFGVVHEEARKTIVEHDLVVTVKE